jgi:hypothetical protein
MVLDSRRNKIPQGLRPCRRKICKLVMYHTCIICESGMFVSQVCHESSIHELDVSANLVYLSIGCVLVLGVSMRQVEPRSPPHHRLRMTADSLRPALCRIWLSLVYSEIIFKRSWKIIYEVNRLSIRVWWMRGKNQRLRISSLSHFFVDIDNCSRILKWKCVFQWKCHKKSSFNKKRHFHIFTVMWHIRSSFWGFINILRDIFFWSW